jgi:electron transfer flavoprotein alpha subunit
MASIFAFITHRDGIVDEAATELLGAVERIDGASRATAVVTGWGPHFEAACESLRGSFGEVWKIAHESLAYPNAELVRQALVNVLPACSIVLLPHSHFGVDLAPGLAIRMGAAFAPDIVDVHPLEGTSLRVVRQEFGGQVSVHVRCDVSTGAVITTRPGAFKTVQRQPSSASVIDMSSRIGTLTARRRYVRTIAVESGDVDITKHSILVSVGRGIGDAENVGLAQELADTIGGAVSCSRPVVDAKWLDKSRQVGSSGRSVRPRVYLACGISGSFQHLAGLKGNPFVVAINKNPKAPIFRAADVGIVDDILEFLPALTARIRDVVAVSR